MVGMREQWLRCSRLVLPLTVVLVTIGTTCLREGSEPRSAASGSEEIPAFAQRNATVLSETAFRSDWISVAERQIKDPATSAAIARSDAELELAISEDATDDVLWHNRAWTQRLLGHLDQSNILIEKAIQLAPFDFVYRASRALFAVWDQDDATATSNLAKALELAPQIASSQFFGDLQQTNPTIAADALQNAIVVLALQAGDPIADAKRARLYLVTGNFATAETLLYGSLSQLPNLGGAWRTLALVDQHEGKSTLTSARNAAYILLGIYHDKGSEGYAALRMGFQYTPHSNRFSVRYHVPSPTMNDVFPQELLYYISPISESNM